MSEEINEQEILDGIPDELFGDDNEVADISPGEMSKYLGIKPDLLRYYSNVFSEFLSFDRDSEDKGSHRKYTPHDLRILLSIVSMCVDKKMKTKDAIKVLKENGYSTPKDIEIVKAQNLNIKLASEINSFKEVLSSLANEIHNMQEAHEEQIKALNEAHEEQMKAINESNEEQIGNLKAQLDNLTEIIKFTNKRKLKKYEQSLNKK